MTLQSTSITIFRAVALLFTRSIYSPHDIENPFSQRPGRNSTMWMHPALVLTGNGISSNSISGSDRPPPKSDARPAKVSSSLPSRSPDVFVYGAAIHSPCSIPSGRRNCYVAPPTLTCNGRGYLEAASRRTENVNAQRRNVQRKRRPSSPTMSTMHRSDHVTTRDGRQQQR